MIMGVSPAVALTVAVFFMSISRGEWVELWAGLLGAIPAAVISAAVAAGVAVTVLNRSNAHQQALAAEAAAEQQRLTDIQLEQQKRLSDLQLAEQRREAATTRERISIADIIASAGALVVLRQHVNYTG